MLLYFFGALIPPLGILLYGRIMHAAFNALLWTYAIMTPGVLGLILWLGAAMHATYVIHDARTRPLRNNDFSL